MLDTIKNIFRDLRLRTPLRRFSPAFHRYEFMFTPAQLAFLVRAIDETEPCQGSIVEIGCAGGRTTVFLNMHLDEIRSAREYVCIDTFAGFTEEDVEFEVTHRAKARSLLDGFRINRKEWFDRNLADNGIRRARTYQGDINRFDLRANVPTISLCIVDVDLYRPVKSALEKVLPLMSPGGIIVVDDVIPKSLFDGAYQAYCEFTAKRGLSPTILHGRLGVLEIPSAQGASSGAS